MTFKFQKKQIIILLSLIAGIGIAGIAVLFSVLSPNDFRDNITQAARKTLGRELSIEGNIRVSVFPWIGIKVNQIALANPQNFGKEPMIRVQEADISVKLLSLYHKKPETKVLVLKNPEIHLIRDQNGQNNWDDLRHSEKKAESSDTSDDMLKELAIGGIRISDGKIVIEDKKENRTLHISQLNLETGVLKIGKPGTVKMKFRLDSDKPDIHLNAEADTGFASDSEKITLNNTRLNLILEKLSLALSSDIIAFYLKESRLKTDHLNLSTTSEIVLKTALDAALNADSGSIRLSDLMLKADETTLHGKVHLTQIKPMKADFDLNTDQIDLDRYLARSSSEKEKKHKTDHTNFLQDSDISGILRISRLKVYNMRGSELRLTVSEKDGLLRINPITATMYRGKLNGEISKDFRGKSSETGINLHLSGFNAGEFIQDISGKSQIAGGKGDISLRLTGRSPDFLKTLNGRADMKITDAVLKGHNIPGLIELTGYPFKALLQKLGAYKEEPAQTSIRSLIARFDIQNGRAVAKEVVMKTPDVRISAEGFADLPHKILDAKLSVDVNEIVNVPITIKGTFAKPDIFVNPVGVVGNSVVNIGKKIIEAPVNIGESILKGVGSLFSGSKPSPTERKNVGKTKKKK
jgi:AsmA protein